MNASYIADSALRLVKVVDRGGAVHAELTWRDDALDRLEVPGASVRGAIIQDPLLGDAHTIEVDGAVCTTMSAIDWRRPTQIPAVAAPGKLPPGAGGAILNTIALLAQRAGVSVLRYAGPYPTSAVWTVLSRSFRTSAREDEFTGRMLDRALRVARDEMPIDFAPAPHERVTIPGGHVELRAGLERAVIDGVAYAAGGSPARLVDQRAEIWFGDALWAHVATFGSDGTLIDGPHPLPSVTSAMIGREFPGPLRAAIAELVGESVAAPLAADVRALVTERPIHWADLGARAARFDGDGFAVHVALWDRVAPLGMVRLALALAEALGPVAAAAAVRRALASSYNR